MHFKILKMIPTSGFLTALECTKFVCGRGSAPNPAGGAYSSPPDPLAGLRGRIPTSNGEERKGWERQEGYGTGEKARGREGMERKRRGENGKEPAPSFRNFWIRPW